MHKKLFGLLATAVVGLTLTSCGGGGGGGGGEGGGDSAVVGAGVQGAPNSVVGRTITQSYYVNGVSTKWEYKFVAEKKFEGAVYLNNNKAADMEGSYEYDRLGDDRAVLRDVTYVSVERTLLGVDEDFPRNLEGRSEDIELIFNPETGQLLSADGATASMR